MYHLVLIWLCESKIWTKGKIMLYEYRQLYSLHKKTEDMYSDIANDVEIRFDTSNYELDRPLPKGKYKKVIGLMRN